MCTNTSPLIAILSSLEDTWEYVPLIRERIENGVFSASELAELTQILWSGMQGVDNENTKIQIDNILFQKYLIKTEESGIRETENKSIDSLLLGL
jgi:hypothetical protein